jgi:hypothetical protein
MAAQLIQTLPRDTQLCIQDFVNASRYQHPDTLSCVDQMKWVARALELLKNTGLSRIEKRDIVNYIYKESHDDDQKLAESIQTNTNMSVHIDVNSAVQFIWDSTDGVYELELKKTGFLSCLCCKSMEAGYVRGKGIQFQTDHPEACKSNP